MTEQSTFPIHIELRHQSEVTAVTRTEDGLIFQCKRPEFAEQLAASLQDRLGHDPALPGDEPTAPQITFDGLGVVLSGANTHQQYVCLMGLNRFHEERVGIPPERGCLAQHVARLKDPSVKKVTPPPQLSELTHAAHMLGFDDYTKSLLALARNRGRTQDRR